MAKLVVGINDLATLHPEVAAEADGLDPSLVHAGSNQKMRWKCDEKHIWTTSVSKRTGEGTSCPYCANRKIWVGFDDLQTKFPDIAKEADGWDPSKVLAGTNKKMPWKCFKGHKWEASLSQRTRLQTSCPYCSNQECWSGFNDLQTKFPEIAKEADGWDPSKVLAGGKTVMPWKCFKGHTWNAVISSRTGVKTGCP